MSLFLCSTHCESCQEKEVCPLKEQVQASIAVEVKGASEEQNHIIKNILQKMTPKDFIDISEIDIFNFVSSMKILQEKIGPLTISQIAKRMEDHISQKEPLIKDDELIFKEKIFGMIMGISQRIYDFLNENCEYECSACFIRRDCQILRDSSS